MRKFLTLTLALAGIAVGAAAPAFARDDARCTLSPGAVRLSADAVRAKLAEGGYKVMRVEDEHGCYEVHATDQGGTAVELRVDPASAKILRTKKHD
ncbi:MAG TPA: PepSY domain-containing protein [Alphaproteobacteria bacterium]|jgi:hypothetical protein